MNRKNLINAGLVILVFILTMYYVFAGEDLSLLLDSMIRCWLIPACCFVVFFIWGESFIIWYLLKEYGYIKRKRACFLLSAVGFFFSAITPSAGGGQPMQVYFMNKMKIPISISSIILMVVTITYKLVLVIVQIGILLFGSRLTQQYLGSVIYIVYLGLFLNIIGIGGLLLFVFCPGTVRFLGRGMIRLMNWFFQSKAGRWMTAKTGKRYQKLPQRVSEKIEAGLDKYHEASWYLKSRLHVLINVQAFTFVQRFALFSVTVFVYLALALKGTGWLDIIFLQSTISLSVDMLPMPGGMGISEYLFEQIFSPIFGAQLLPGLVLSRGISYYVQLAVSGIGTMVAYVYFKCKKEHVVVPVKNS